MVLIEEMKMDTGDDLINFNDSTEDSLLDEPDSGEVQTQQTVALLQSSGAINQESKKNVIYLPPPEAISIYKAFLAKKSLVQALQKQLSKPRGDKWTGVLVLWDQDEGVISYGDNFIHTHRSLFKYHMDADKQPPIPQIVQFRRLSRNYAAEIMSQFDGALATEDVKEDKSPSQPSAATVQMMNDIPTPKRPSPPRAVAPPRTYTAPPRQRPADSDGYFPVTRRRMKWQPSQPPSPPGYYTQPRNFYPAGFQPRAGGQQGAIVNWRQRNFNRFSSLPQIMA